LFDRTGTLEARIFDNVDAAEAAFNNDDYLLVAGKVTAFHGKPQLVVEKLERLDAGPIDANEFTKPAPAATATPGAAAERPAHVSASSGESAGGRMPKHIRQKLIGLLDDPAISSGIDALVRHLERYIDERVSERLGEKPSHESRPGHPERSGGGESRRSRGFGGAPKIEHRPKVDEKSEKSEKPAPRDSGLPRDLAFKPFNALAPTSSGDAATQEAPAAAPSSTPTPTSNGS
jgi:hypothetical protein